MVEYIQMLLPEVEVRAGGLTSIDVTQKGIDKEYGIRQIKEQLGIDFPDMLFVGDAIFPGGNDYAALNTGVISFKVENVGDTKRLVRRLIS